MILNVGCNNGCKQKTLKYTVDIALSHVYWIDDQNTQKFAHVAIHFFVNFKVWPNLCTCYRFLMTKARYYRR